MTGMARDPLGHWLHALRFEIYRLQFWPGQIRAEILKSEIRKLESQPVEGSGSDLDTSLQNLETLKQDLADMQEEMALIGQLMSMRNQLHGSMREHLRGNGDVSHSMGDANEIFNKLHNWYEKKKLEQRMIQWRNFAILRHFWPKVDWETKRTVVQMFGLYSKRRLMWGALNLRIGLPLRMGRLASRLGKRFGR